MAKKRVLISVSNKEGIENFAKTLSEKYDYEIISTGGTYKSLKKAKVPVINISDITNYPEILDGRVKTLHPAVHGGILADLENNNHQKTLQEKDITPIDMVVVNLYPFEEVSANLEATTEELIENIDIGGVTLIRSAAKNCKRVAVVVEPSTYDAILAEMEENKGLLSQETKQELAVKAFKHTFNYDSAIYKRLKMEFGLRAPDQEISLNLTKVQDLRYGENPHQSAGVYLLESEGLEQLPFTVLQGKQLSYNNLVDLTAALNIIAEFPEQSASCVIKHSNPCGVAVGKDILSAYKKAFNTDPISAFGGIVGLNKEVTKELAELLSSIFLEIIVAPSYTTEALSILSKKKNLRVVEIDTSKNWVSDTIFKPVVGGILVQEADKKQVTETELTFATKAKPSEKQLDDLLFAWKVAKHVSSNAIVIAKNGQTVGIGAGQTSRIGSMEIALRQACDEAKDAVVASDGFFPAVDNIQAAAQNRVAAIIQPGGSIKDKDVIEACEKLKITMVTTGIRHFKH